MIPGITYSEIMPIVITWLQPFSFIIATLLGIGIVFLVLFKIVQLAKGA